MIAAIALALTLFAGPGPACLLPAPWHCDPPPCEQPRCER